LSVVVVRRTFFEMGYFVCFGDFGNYRFTPSPTETCTVLFIGEFNAKERSCCIVIGADFDAIEDGVIEVFGFGVFVNKGDFGNYLFHGYCSLGGGV
jgi:hypothetical protein